MKKLILIILILIFLTGVIFACSQIRLLIKAIDEDNAYDKFIETGLMEGE